MKTNKPQPMVRRLATVVVVVSVVMLATTLGRGQQPAADAVDPSKIIYVMPFMTDYSDTRVQDMVSRLGPGGSYVKVVYTKYVWLKFLDWNVNINDPVAVKAAIQPSLDEINQDVLTAVSQGMPISLAIFTAIKESVDPAQIASQVEDVRNMQWYADNYVASGWWTFSRYARKQQVGELLQLRPDLVHVLFRQCRADAAGDVETHATGRDHPTLVGIERRHAADREAVTPMSVRHRERRLDDARQARHPGDLVEHLLIQLADELLVGIEHARHTHRAAWLHHPLRRILLRQS